MIATLQWSRQSVVSFILLAVLCSIGAAIVLIHANDNQSAFSPYIPPENAQASLPLPANFVVSGKQEQYNAETLYEKINGKAPLYLEAGFITLTTQRFMHRKDSSLWFELFLYDMGTALNAFSVYSTQKRPGTTRIPSLEPHDHYKTGNGLHLRLGSRYIECIGSSSTAALDKALIVMGQDLLSAAPASGAIITEFQLFPHENLVPGSFKLILNNAFGSEALQKTFIAKYRLNDQLITAFISTQMSPADAKQVAQNYYHFLLENDGTPDTSMPPMQLVDLYGLMEIIFTDGPYVAGIHEGENRIDALAMSEQLRASIAKERVKNNK